MGIYIKGMEMPQFFDRLFVGRSFDGRIFIRNEREDEKSDSVTWYPVIEIPPHGRLIDADAIKEKIDRQRPGRMYEDAWTLTIIDDAPTIIQADMEERRNVE